MGRNGNAIVIKEINENIVRKALKKREYATKQQIAEDTGLSIVTVGTILQRLVQNKEAYETNLAESNGGRPAHQFRYNENSTYVLTLITYGLDILHVGVFNLFGKCVYSYQTELRDINLHTFESYVSDAIERFPTIKSIGFVLPGMESDGKMFLSDYKKLTGTPFSKHYSTLFHLPVLVENDVNSAVIGYCKRMKIGAETSVYLYFPEKYPPGAGIGIDGKLYRGSGNYAGEVADIPLGIDWRDPSLYLSSERFCEACVKLIAAVCCVLNPANVILYGSFLNPGQVESIRQNCESFLPKGVAPRVMGSGQFVLDCQNGIAEEALLLSESKLELSDECCSQ